MRLLKLFPIIAVIAVIFISCDSRTRLPETSFGGVPLVEEVSPEQTDENVYKDLDEETSYIRAMLENAYKGLRDGGGNFVSEIEQCIRDSGVTESQLSRIQTLIFSKDTGKVAYLTVSEKEVPCAGMIVPDGIEHYFAESPAMASAEEIGNAVRLGDYLTDMAGRYCTYNAEQERYEIYEIKDSMSAEEVLDMSTGEIGDLDALNNIISKGLENDVYRINIYEIRWFVPEVLRHFGIDDVN